MGVDEVRALLRDRVKAGGGTVRWSETNGVNATVVSETLRGIRDPQPKVLAALGLRLVKTYYPINQESP